MQSSDYMTGFFYIAGLALVVSIVGVGIYYAMKGFPPASRLVEEIPPTPVELEEGTAHFHMFYTNWCPHCKSAKPVWESLKQSMKNGDLKFGGTTVKLFDVNCESDTNKCDSYAVDSYPTFKLDVKGKRYEYQGPADVTAWKQFLEQALGRERKTV